MTFTVGVEKLPSDASNVVAAYVLLNTDLILPNPLTAINDTRVFAQIYSTLGLDPKSWFLSQITLSEVTQPYTALYAYSFAIRLVKVGTRDPLLLQFMGPVGPQGQVGKKGEQGDQGPRGPTGPAGATGPYGGPPGATGATGPGGRTGPAGPTGPRGFQGSPGSTGPLGGQGPTGPQGPPGPQGPVGPTGPIGLRGPTGAGVQGSPGPTGPRGATGVPGTAATGPVGPAGATGMRGAGFAPGQLFRADLPLFAGGLTLSASGTVAAGGQLMNPDSYRMSGAALSVKFVAMANRSNSGTGFVSLRSVTDGGVGVATLAVGAGGLAKYSTPLTLLSVDKVYEIAVSRGTATAVGVGYAGFEIDRTF
jgi:hypothetical protein